MKLFKKKKILFLKDTQVRPHASDYCVIISFSQLINLFTLFVFGFIPFYHSLVRNVIVSLTLYG